MVEKVTAAIRSIFLGLLTAFLALPFTGHAHRLDEYLQATLVNIQPSEITFQINLTPGVAVADKVLAKIDTDADGTISTNELIAYAGFLKRQLVAQLDGHNLALNLTGSSIPEVAELRSGWGIIKIEFSATSVSLAPGPHKLVFKNRHLPGLSVYLINAAQPKSDRVRIVRQKRNSEQSKGEIDIVVSPPARPLVSKSTARFSCAGGPGSLMPPPLVGSTSPAIADLARKQSGSPRKTDATIL